MNTVITPFCTAYLGVTRAEGTSIIAIAIGSGIVGVALVVGPLERWAGQMGALKWCLAFGVLLPGLLPFCADVRDVMYLFAALSAPAFMLGPLFSAIKSNLVCEEEQGLIQGALASVANLATAVSDVVFGLLYSYLTQGGTNPLRSSASPLFFGSAAFAALAWLLALTLPATVPPPVRSTPASEPLLPGDVLLNRRFARRCGHTRAQV
ncbi:unnamed protein product [Polarella glacialis]|uniref:Uncharacterized protein n=1 Tax=Polarella glacialis TaxID=89957 RepID=A0A813F2V2_POLGL|nr:unnamed protein product [Polarella glacialis]